MERSGVLTPVVPGRAAERALEDAVELRVTAKAGFQRGVEHGAGLAVTVKVEKPLDALTVAKVHHGEACLLVKEAAEAAGTESGFLGQLSQRVSGSIVADEPRRTLDCGVNVLDGDVASPLEALPGEEQRVGNPGVEKGLMPGGGEIGEEPFEALHVLLGEAAACVAVDIGLNERTSRNVDGNAANHPAAKDSDPHTKVGSLFDEDMLLSGEEPEKISTADFVTSFAEEVDAPAAGDEIQFKFGVSMAAVGGGKVVVLPDATIQFRLQVQVLTHDKKR